MPIDYLYGYRGSFKEKATSRLKEMAKSSSDIPFGKDDLLCVHSKKELLDHYDITSTRINKRISAVVDHIGDFYNHLGDIADRKTIESLAVFSNGLILRGGYNVIDEEQREITTAAAIWILDQLNLQEDLDKIYDLLPDASENRYLINFINHPQYDNNLMSSLVKLLIFRNKNDYSGVGEREGTLVSDNPRLNGKDSAKIREAYESVIELLDPEAIQNAVKDYEAKIWEFYRISFQARIKVLSEIDRLQGELDKINQGFVNDIAKKKEPYLLLKQTDFSISNPVTHNNQAEEISKKISMLTADLNHLKNITFTDLALVNSREKVAKRLKGVIGNRLVQELCEFSIDDPFVMAFALFYLLDTNSDLPWLYYGSITVAYTAIDQLPFLTKYSEFNDKVYMADVNRALYRHRFKGYHWDGTDASGEPIERDKGRNLSQLLCASTFTLLPRIARAKDNFDSFFDDLDAVKETDKELYKILYYMLNSLSDKADSLQTYQLINEINAFVETQTGEVVPELIETAQLNESVRMLNQQNKKLTTALYEESRLRKKTRLHLQDQEQENQRLRRELADLRELIFLQDSPKEETKRQERVVRLPVQTHGRIVSFGGHPSWLTEMKKLLPNVVFYSSDLIPNRDVIRGADEVWIQTQYISHAAFYRIISSIGAKNVQLRYFTSSSAENCARQLIEMLKK